MHEKLSTISYYKTGGTCLRLFEPTCQEEVADALNEIAQHKWPYFVLGGGTNSLVLDEHWSGAVISFRKMNSIKVEGATLQVEAGADNSEIAKVAAAHGLAGVAWMYRLPGQIGGTIRMNARCYGGEISQIAQKVNCLTIDGKPLTYAGQRVFRGYKDTLFMVTGDLICSAELHLVPGDREEIAKKMNFCEADRVSKGQFLYPSCGCVFKNDYGAGVPSGMLLEKVGAKNFKSGGAEVSPYHANFIFNKGCSSRDILELALKMREAVWDVFGVWLEFEMEILGDLPVDLRIRVAEKKLNAPTPALKIARDEFTSRVSLNT